MTTTLAVLCALALLAFFCEWIDSSIGMGYGTILSPVLVMFFSDLPKEVTMPAIFVSQACGGLIAAYCHHGHGHISFAHVDGKLSPDAKLTLWITGLGMIAAGCAAYFGAVFFSKEGLSIWIGAIVLLMGILLLFGFTPKHAQWKMVGVGLVSALNKGLTGGGFGPLVTGGQLVSGGESKKAVSITTAAEGPICIVAALIYWATNGISGIDVMIALTIGSVLASRLGAFTTKKLAEKLPLTEIIASALIILGASTLLYVFKYIDIPVSM